MDSKFRLDRFLPKVAVALVMILAASATEVARAELMFEHRDYRNGGTTRYQSDGSFHMAEFYLTEAIRVDAISGWFQNYDMDVTAGIGEFGVEDGNRGAIQWHIPKVPNPPPPALSLPGHWAKADVKWDLQPGHFGLYFDNAGMGMSYNDYTDVRPFTSFTNITYFEDGSYYVGGRQGFGVRLYGTPLSAVPEPAVYGAMGAMLLFGAVILRRAGGSRRAKDARSAGMT